MTFEPRSERFSSLPPRPQPFHMTDAIYQNGIWSFWLSADEAVIQYVSNLNCVLPFANSPFLRRPGGRVMVSINPRYDHAEAWTWLHNTLEGETQVVELGETWEQAIDRACQCEDDL